MKPIQTQSAFQVLSRLYYFWVGEITLKAKRQIFLSVTQFASYPEKKQLFPNLTASVETANCI